MLQITEVEQLTQYFERLQQSPAPVGVVSLLNMLRLFPRVFLVITQRLIALSTLELTEDIALDDARVTEFLADVKWFAQEAGRIGLPFSAIQAERILEASKNGDREQISRGAQELSTRVWDELGANFCYIVPKERIGYLSQEWPISHGIIADPFPSAIPEFKRAGRCFAYGENTACVFHLMRVVDLGLRAVAASLTVPYDARKLGRDCRKDYAIDGAEVSAQVR